MPKTNICNYNGADVLNLIVSWCTSLHQNQVTKQTVPDFSQFSGKLEHELSWVKNSQGLENLAKLPVLKFRRGSWPKGLGMASMIRKATAVRDRCSSNKKISFLCFALFPLTASALGPEEVCTNTTFPAGVLRRRLLHQNGNFVPPAGWIRTHGNRFSAKNGL